ncbi:hypothetical protein [Enterococcus sp. AZ109]|uniref:hypothetical protein n=1 Tax=Enterococcus sp. AZ109 TaxID=2774634 RepID=UPI003F213124
MNDAQLIELALLIKKEEDDELKKLLEQAEYQFVTILIEYILSIESKMEDAFQTDYEELQEAVDELVAKFVKKSPTEKQIKRSIKKRSFNSKVKEEVLPELEEAFFVLLEAFQEIYGNYGEFDLKSEAYKELQKWLKDLPNLLQKTTDDAVIRTVGKHYDKDKDKRPDSMSLAEQWVFGYFRARSIAILELLRMYSGSQYEALMLNDNVIGLKWRHADGVNEPRPTHVAADGEVVAKGEFFYINQTFIRYPRDPLIPISESINCHCFLEPMFIYGHESGAKRRTLEEKDELANRIYESARNRKSDVKRVAKYSGMKRSDVRKIYNHMFINEYDLMTGRKRFDPDIDMAESWQRLFLGKNIQEHDIIMLKHELMEWELMNKKNYSYSEAHQKTNKTWNYEKALDEYLDNIEGK